MTTSLSLNCQIQSESARLYRLSSNGENVTWRRWRKYAASGGDYPHVNFIPFAPINTTVSVDDSTSSLQKFSFLRLFRYGAESALAAVVNSRTVFFPPAILVTNKRRIQYGAQGPRSCEYARPSAVHLNKDPPLVAFGDISPSR